VAAAAGAVQTFDASMGSGRGDRNQDFVIETRKALTQLLQWGPVVVTGISRGRRTILLRPVHQLQWGPVVVTGIRGELRCPYYGAVFHASMGSGRGDRNQAESNKKSTIERAASMGSGRGDRNQHDLLLFQQLSRVASMGSGRGDRNQATSETWPNAAIARFNGVRSW